MQSPQLLLIGAVATVGVLHTVVPDHWVPITLLARQRGWSKAETARAAFQAGVGHVVSTLAIGSIVWFAGATLAVRFGGWIDGAASLALIALGGWIAVSAWRELHRGGSYDNGHGHGHGQRHGHGHNPDHRHDDDGHGGHGHHHVHDFGHRLQGTGSAALSIRHFHVHRHARGAPIHAHWHEHTAETTHAIAVGSELDPPLHEHVHKTSGRTMLLLILGSSPMIEGIPAFFAASRYGMALLLTMAAVFAISTIATYMLLCMYSAAGLQRIRLGPLERYGEVLSGAFIALVGLAFWVWPVL